MWKFHCRKEKVKPLHTCTLFCQKCSKDYIITLNEVICDKQGKMTFYVYFDSVHVMCYLKATHDPHYLQVGKLIVENLNKHARVPCGFAALKDVVTGKHEDQYVQCSYTIVICTEKPSLNLTEIPKVLLLSSDVFYFQKVITNLSTSCVKNLRTIFVDCKHFTVWYLTICHAVRGYPTFWSPFIQSLLPQCNYSLSIDF